MSFKAGFCTRCKVGEKRVFLIATNPSLAWRKSEDVIPTKAEHVCADCLTKDEIVQVLAPAAQFVIEQMLQIDTGGIQELVPGMRYLHARLAYKAGSCFNPESAARSILNA